jgi:hypothetical protein
MMIDHKEGSANTFFDQMETTKQIMDLTRD